MGIIAMLLLTIANALATIPTGFNLDNQIAVEGDWVWTGSSWTQPTPKPVTANFGMKIRSPSATNAAFIETAVYGQPWHLDYDSQAQVNAPATYTNELNAITVNPPDTTPGTAWTKIHYVEHTGSVYSGAVLSVNGYGNIYVKSVSKLQDAGGQIIDLNIN